MRIGVAGHGDGDTDDANGGSDGSGGEDEDSAGCNIDGWDVFSNVEISLLHALGFRVSALAGSEVVTVEVPFKRKCIEPTDFQTQILTEVQSAYNRNRGRQ